MAEPARKLAADELKKISRLTKKSPPPDNIVDFSQYKRKFEQNRLAAKRAKTEAEIAEEYKEGTPMAGVSSAAGLTGGIPLNGEIEKTAGEKPTQETETLDQIHQPTQRTAPAGDKGGQAADEGKRLNRDAKTTAPIPQQAKAATPTSAQSQKKTGKTIEPVSLKTGADGQAMNNQQTKQKATGEKPAERERNFARTFSQAIKTARELGAGLAEAGQTKTDNVGVIGKMLFVPLLALHIFTDILPFVTVEISSAIDWILDIGLYIATAIVLFIITGDIIKTFTSRRAAANALKTLAEVIPVVGLLPLHTFVLIIIYLDLQHNILSKTPALKFLKKPDLK